MLFRKLFIQVASFISRKLERQPVYIEIKRLIYPEGYLKNIRCLVTGGSSGIGLAIAAKLIECGGTVVITGRSESKLKEVCNLLGPNCTYIVFDSTKFSDYSNFYDKLYNVMPHVNSIVLNAGISLHEAGFEFVSEENFDIQFDTNLKANFFLLQEFVKRPEMKNILLISSETGDMKCVLPYGLSKAALNSLIPSLSLKYYQKGIRINAVAPGRTLTNMIKNANNDKSNYYSTNTSGRYFCPEEIAEVVLFLLSDASKCISGEIIHTNAGNHYRPQ